MHRQSLDETKPAATVQVFHNTDNIELLLPIEWNALLVS